MAIMGIIMTFAIFALFLYVVFHVAILRKFIVGS